MANAQLALTIWSRTEVQSGLPHQTISVSLQLLDLGKQFLLESLVLVLSSFLLESRGQFAVAFAIQATQNIPPTCSVL
jgi:hypothetical protein